MAATNFPSREEREAAAAAINPRRPPPKLDAPPVGPEPWGKLVPYYPPRWVGGDFDLWSVGRMNEGAIARAEARNERRRKKDEPEEPVANTEVAIEA